MSREMARAVIAEEIRRLRDLPYNELTAMIHHDTGYESIGPDGRTYQVETTVVWDSKKGGDVRVIVAADDGTFLASIKPDTDSFIKNRDGRFVGE